MNRQKEVKKNNMLSYFALTFICVIFKLEKRKRFYKKRTNTMVKNQNPPWVNIAYPSLNVLSIVYLKLFTPLFYFIFIYNKKNLICSLPKACRTHKDRL